MGIYLFSIFIFLVLSVTPLVVDMFTRKQEHIGREPLSRALTWSGVYVMAALIWAGWLAMTYGADYSTLFLSGYAIEKAMSMDNLIIFTAVFAYFGVQPEHEHRVLHWGVIGSAVLRFVFIAVGLAAFFIFGRVLDLAFGLFVCWTAWKILKSTDEEQHIDHGKRWYIRLLKRWLPVSVTMDGRFFVTGNGWGGVLDRIPAITPLFMCLVAIEFTDIAFAFDSVPAVIGITRDSLIAYSAVMFAVLGLRSLYFVLEALKRYTSSLNKAVIAILFFVGGKMILHALLNVDVDAGMTLIVILLCLSVGIMMSIKQQAMSKVEQMRRAAEKKVGL